MSGGYFDYKQYQIQDLIEEMEELLDRLDSDDDTIEVDDLESLKTIILTNKQHLQMAKLYTQRIDWFLSGDDGEETFYKRIEEDKLNI